MTGSRRRNRQRIRFCWLVRLYGGSLEVGGGVTGMLLRRRQGQLGMGFEERGDIARRKREHRLGGTGVRRGRGGCKDPKGFFL